MQTTPPTNANENKKTKMNNKRFILKSATTLAFCAAAFMLVPNSMATEKDTLNAADVKFVKREAAAGMAEVKISTLAVTKATNADVKAMAEMLVKDHTAVNSELQALATQKGVELSAVIAPAHATTFQKLEKLEGTAFDKEFLAIIISDHKTCIGSFEKASKDAKDTDVKNWAEKTLPALKAHLAKAEALNTKELTSR
jgi:putative membrane protein